MGYRSEIYLKTTAEGFVMLKQLDDKIKIKEEKPLYGLAIEKTPEDFYRMSALSVKWYDEFEQVINFNEALNQLKKQNIPFVFIRIGEDVNDVEVNQNWTDDMPEELFNFAPQVSIDDEDEGRYSLLVHSDDKDE